MLHFHLRNPIQVGGKNTTNVTFYRDVIDSSEDINARSGYSDERTEKRHRQRINKIFREFVRASEKLISQNRSLLRRIEFEMPVTDLKFTGVPHRQNVTIMPTVSCLVALDDSPAFVLTLADIEVASFERVQAQLRFFDVIFLKRDMRTFIEIGNVPNDKLETLKKYLDDANILFYENKQNLNWHNVTTEIRRNARAFQASGWNGFFGAADLIEDEGDPRPFRNDNNVYSDEEDCEFVDRTGGVEQSSDDDSYGSEVDESDSSGEEGHMEDAPSWEQLERQAVAENV
eukprot:TRINITY_DN5039_c0_g1_i1.p1 TRINITY_DN5039_c0_g1~~TRINITY_DN5039_c0_g1_i1.p1  ORF type:complete len:287 (+),score=62.71 TRINITY_DN5039_c0_g1_i1:630-1490(+)